MATEPAFVRWEEKVVSNDKGRRLVHYYLKDARGKRVLAVVGREKSLRHMSYMVTAQFSAMMATAGRSCYEVSPSSPLDFGGGGMKWKSRRELMDWLSAIVAGKGSVPCTSEPMFDGFSKAATAAAVELTTAPISKGISSGKMGHHSKDFSWLGSSWDCKRKRKHYRSFCRNGITISVHDFVHVMAEDLKRLVAYVEDLYEDVKANKMVVVRWFHKVDEVGIVLPLDINDREIFFSLCLQDLSIECIDGLAAVLSAQDWGKFQDEARYKSGSWQPYMCRRQIEFDNVKPFDITQVQGYWSQELLRSMYATPGTLKFRLKIVRGGSKSNPDGAGRDEPKLKNLLNGADANASDKSRAQSAVCKRGEKVTRLHSGPPLLRKELLKQKLMQQQKHLAPGCHVEVLSQDSGIRGCWFHCVVIKRHHDKVKVHYQDVLDADGTGNLEEWVLASRIASPDKLGIRLCGRPVVRPDPSLQSSKYPCTFDVGSVVDAWWHDGWWEGIVICKVTEGKFRVYFPGEQQECVFGLGDLRCSREWVNNDWNQLKDCRPLVSSLLSNRKLENHPALPDDVGVEAQAEPLSSLDRSPETTVKGTSTPNLSEVCNLDALKWSSSRKRRRARESGKGSPGSKRQCGSGSSSSSSQDDAQAISNACSKFLVSKTLGGVDNEICKIGRGDPMLVAPMALCSSLVMSQ